MKHTITFYPVATIWNDYPYFSIKVYNDKNQIITMFQANGYNYELYVDKLTADTKLCLKYLVNNNIIKKTRSSIYVQTYELTQSALLELL